MDFKARLQTLRADLASRASPEEAALYASQIEGLKRSAILEQHLGIGDAAPDFEGDDIHGEPYRLSDALRRGPVIVTFYRGGWCPYCNLQLRAFQALLPEIHAQRASLVAVSPEAPDNTLGTAQQNELGYSVLSDVGLRIAEAYGLSFTLPTELRAAYARHGIDLGSVNAEAEWRLPVPATFLIESDGRIASAHVEADYRERLDPADILRDLRRIGRTSRLKAF